LKILIGLGFNLLITTVEYFDDDIVKGKLSKSIGSLKINAKEHAKLVCEGNHHTKLRELSLNDFPVLSQKISIFNSNKG